MTSLDFKIIAQYAILQQKGGDVKMKAAGWTDKRIADFMEEGLNEDQQTMLDAMRKELDALKELIIPFMKRVYNKDFKEVENYFPMMADFEAMTGLEIQDLVGPDVLLVGANSFETPLKQDPNKGFTIDRTNGDVRIKLDAWEVVTKHVDNATYLLNMGQNVKELTELANTEGYREAVGAFGQEVTTEWLDLAARKGGKAGQRSGIFDVLRKNVGFMTLGFKLSTVLVQPTALLDGAALIGHHAFSGLYNVLTPGSGWFDFVNKNFTEIIERRGGDPSIKELTGNRASEGFAGKHLAGIRRASFWGLVQVDGIVATGVAAGAYEKIVTEKGGVVDFNNPDQDAIREATLLMRRTQASGSFLNTSSAFTQGTITGSVSVDKMLLQFQTFILNRFSLIQHDMIRKGFRIGQTEQGLRIATMLLLAYFAEVGLRRGAEEIIAAATGDDLDEFDEVEISQRALKEIATSIPFVGQVISGIYYKQFPVPVVSMATQGLSRAGFAISAKSDKVRIKNISLAILNAMGEIGGVPGTAQVDQIVRKVLKEEKTKRRF